MTTLTPALHDLPVADPPGLRDGFTQMLAALDAQLDRDLAGPAAPVPAPPPPAPVAPPPAQAMPLPGPAGAQGPLLRSMLAPAVAMVVTIAGVGCAALLIALHWRPTRSMAAGASVAALSMPATAATTPAPAAVPGPLALATRADAPAPGAEATPAAFPCTQVQTALGLCAALASRTTPTTTPESSP